MGFAVSKIGCVNASSRYVDVRFFQLSTGIEKSIIKQMKEPKRDIRAKFGIDYLTDSSPSHEEDRGEVLVNQTIAFLGEKVVSLLKAKESRSSSLTELVNEIGINREALLLAVSRLQVSSIFEIHKIDEKDEELLIKLTPYGASLGI